MRLSPIGTRIRQTGFTYVGLLVLLSVVALASALTLEVAETAARRTAEAELLAIGREMEKAFISYAQATPAGASRYPATLHDLVRDPRSPGTSRYLRRIYVDPVTGTTDWGVVPAPGGGIMAVYSKATGVPIRELPLPLFPAGKADGKTAIATRYSQWVFGHPGGRQPEVLAPATPPIR